MSRKGKFLKVRVSEEEYEQLRVFAKDHGTNMSGLIRLLLRALQKQKADPAKPLAP